MCKVYKITNAHAPTSWFKNYRLIVLKKKKNHNNCEFTNLGFSASPAPKWCWKGSYWDLESDVCIESEHLLIGLQIGWHRVMSARKRFEDLIITVVTCLGLSCSLIVPLCLSLRKLSSLYIRRTLIKYECFKCSSSIASHSFLMRLRGKLSVSESDTILSDTGFESHLDRKKINPRKKKW